MTIKSEWVVCEAGRFRDNMCSYCRALVHWAEGNTERAVSDLEFLRGRILQSGDVKSRRWLLPRVEATLKRLNGGGTADVNAQY